MADDAHDARPVHRREGCRLIEASYQVGGLPGRWLSVQLDRDDVQARTWALSSRGYRHS